MNNIFTTKLCLIVARTDNLFSDNFDEPLSLVLGICLEV